MSEEELKNQINRIAKKIMELEEVAKKKEDYIKTKVKEEFDVKINEIESELQVHQIAVNGLTQKIDKLSSKKKELIPIINDLEKKRNTLQKEKKKTLNEKLKAITDEKKTKMKTINREIKILEKELKNSENK